MQSGADRTSLTPLLRRLRLKVSVRGRTNGEGCALPQPRVFGGSMVLAQWEDGRISWIGEMGRLGQTAALTPPFPLKYPVGS